MDRLIFAVLRYKYTVHNRNYHINILTSNTLTGTYYWWKRSGHVRKYYKPIIVYSLLFGSCAKCIAATINWITTTTDGYINNNIVHKTRGINSVKICPWHDINNVSVLLNNTPCRVTYYYYYYYTYIWEQTNGWIYKINTYL